MKFLKRISLFCVIPSLCFICGLYVKSYFYPNTGSQESYRDKQVNEKQENREVAEFEDKSTCDTQFIVLKYDINNKTEEEVEEDIPFYFIGLNRNEMEHAVDLYAKSPMFKDLQDGIVSAKLILFSKNKVVIRKSYDKKEKTESYYLKVVDNKIVVYLSDMETVFLTTDLKLDEMPDTLQQDIIHVKCIPDLESLYDFLESYTS